MPQIELILAKDNGHMESIDKLYLKSVCNPKKFRDFSYNLILSIKRC